MNHKLKLLLVLFFPLVIYAQENPEETPPVQDSVLITGSTDYTLGISYFGNTVIYPGLRADLEKSWKVFHKTKQKSNRRRGDYLVSKSRELLPVAGLGFYVHPRHYTGIFADVGIKFRQSRSKSFRNKIRRWGFSSGFGIYRSFLPETYKVEGNEVKKVFLAGRAYFYPYLSYHREKSWRRNPNHASFLTVNSMFLMPYNTTTIPLLNLQIGYRFKFNKLQKKNEKSI